MIAVVMASFLTLFAPSWNRTAVILDSVVMVMTSCLTVSAPSRKIITLARMTGDGELPDPVCSQLEQNSSNSRQGCHGHGRLPDREGTNRKIKTLDKNTVFMASCLTLFVPSWNRIALITDSVFMIMASCLTVSGPSRKQKR